MLSIAESVDKKADRKVQNKAFSYGEKLEYNVYYKFIKAGTGTLEVAPNPTKKNGRDCYDIKITAASLKSLEWIYKVKDSYRTVLDAEGIFPWEFEQKIREGSYKRDYKAEFDQNNYKAKCSDGKSYTIPPYIHDVVSAFYYVRTQDLASMKPGSVIQMQNFFKGKTYLLGVKVIGKQNIETESGTYRCILIEPLIKEGGLFKADGRILIWLTDDEVKVPIKVAAQIPIGYVYAELANYKNLVSPIKAKIADK